MNDHTQFLDTIINAERDGDHATAERLLTDDFTGIGPVGFVLPKAIWQQRHTHGLSYDSLSIDEAFTRHYGATAITVARWNARGNAGGQPVPEAARTTFIAVDDDGTWKLAGLQFSYIAGTPGAPGVPLPRQAPR